MWDSSKQPPPATDFQQMPPPPVYQQQVPPQFQQMPQYQQQQQQMPQQVPPQYQQQQQQAVAPQFQQQPIHVQYQQTSQPQSQPPPLVYNIQQSSIPTYPAVQPVVQNEGWFRRNHKNKPQSNSVGAGSLIFLSGGMNMAWKLGLNHELNTVFPITEHIVLSWFIGCIIGAIVGAFICNRIPKKIVFCFAAILVVVSGILQVADYDSSDAIVGSRYLNGIALGLIFPLTFVMVGEECVKTIRGANAASIDTMSFSCGIFIQIIYGFTWSSGMNDTFPAIRMCGVLSIVWGAVSLLISAFLIIESPLLYLARDDEQAAIDALRRLQRPYTITYETYEQLEEHKRYLAESKERTFMENAIYGLPALLKLCFYRSFAALGISYFVNYTFTYSSLLTSQYDIWPFILYAMARWLGPLIVAFSLDTRGRRNPILIGFLVCTVLAFTVGGIFNDFSNIASGYYMSVVKYLLIVFQLFASMSMASSSAYLSEAFPLAVKPYYISIVFIVEMLVHIIILSSKNVNFVLNMLKISDYFLAVGGLSLVFLVFAIFAMPETKGLTLRECLMKFREFRNIHT
ncbi:hypothetical protein DOY81_001218 [Sarcophaga bullata]|nr:hypothetical protein DOY81_001218 [Sarcophaga bullata]